MSAALLKVVSFDLDGTLVDTAGEIAEAANRCLDDVGIARRPQDEITRLIGKGTRELMTRLLARIVQEQPALASTLDTDAVMHRFEHHYAETAGRIGLPYPGCVAMLETLQGAGLRLACVTNKEQRHAERVLGATGLAGYFELLIGGDTLPFKKPDARVFEHVLAHFGVTAAQAVHVGDSAIDVETSRNAGLPAWVLPHGYNAGVPVADARPDRLFDDLSAVAAHIVAGRAAALADGAVAMR